MSERRLLFDQDHVQVVARMVEDEDTRPDDYDCYGRSAVSAWDEDRWQFVGMIVTVTVHDIELAEGSLWGIEHGDMSEDIEADAWELTPATYEATEGGKRLTVMGSPLWGVVEETVDDAGIALAKLTGATAGLSAARRWADPNASA